MNITRTSIYCIIYFIFFISLSQVQETKGTFESIEEPYPELNGGQFSGPPVADSFDPLVQYRWLDNVNTSQLQIYYLYPVTATSDAQNIENIETLTSKTPNALVTGAGNIMFDFKIESAAWLEFDSPNLVLSNNNVEMSISEYNQPAIVNSGPQSPVKTAVPVQYGTTFRLELNSELYEGVRFGWIHVSSVSSSWNITGVRIVCQIKPTNYAGSFLSSNSVFNKIWYTGAYTVKLNLLGTYFGSILMDRGDRFSWTGDAHTSQACALVAFSNYDFISQNIARTATESNGIESYSLYWILSLIDYYYYTNDITTFINAIPNVQGKIAHALSIYGANPSLGFFGHDVRTGAAFEVPSCQENQNSYMMLVLRILNDYSEALGVANQTQLQQEYKDNYITLVTKLKQTPDWYSSFGIHACTEAINANITTQEEEQAIYQQVFSDPIQIVSYAPFNQYFIVAALGKMGQMETALEATLMAWGGQLELGATSFWEVYSPQWNSFMNPHDPPVNGQNGYSSMCHPWAGGITRWLTENVVGIKPTSPGFSTYTAAPYISQTYNLTSVNGSVLTLKGLISIGVSVDFENSEALVSIVSPEGTLGRVGVPKIGLSISKIVLDDNLVVYTDDLTNKDEDTNFVYVQAKPGSHQYSVYYSDTSRTFFNNKQFNDATYAGDFLGSDTATQGNWIGKYGSDGYYMFAYNGQNPVSKLPSYVTSFNWNNNPGGSATGTPRFYSMASGTSDPRALQNDSNNTRALGAIATQDPSACYQTVHIDVILNSVDYCTVSLYLVDYDNQSREQVVELYDEQTKSIVAPYQFISNFSNGIYLTFGYSKSFQIRLQQVRGGDSVLSGVFFGKLP